MSDGLLPKRVIYDKRCAKCGEAIVEAAPTDKPMKERLVAGADAPIVVERQQAIPGTGNYSLISVGGALFAVPGTDYRAHVCKGSNAEFQDTEVELEEALSYALGVARKPPAARSQRKMWRALQVLYRAHVRRFPLE